MKSCTKESTIVPQLLYLPGVHFNHADGAGDGRISFRDATRSRSVSAGLSPAGYGDCAERSAEGNRFILAFSNAV